MQTRARHRWVLVAAVLVAVLLTSRFLLWREGPQTDAERARVWSSAVIAAPTQIHSPPDVLLGRVVDAETRKPIPQFRIMLQPWDAPENATLADAAASPRTIGPLPGGGRDGVFRIGGLPRGEWRMTILAMNREPFEARLLIADGEERTTAPLPLRRGRSITGRVFNAADGNGIRGATVMFRDAHRTGSHWRTPRTVRTLQGGWFAIEGVPVGNLRIDVQSEGYVPRQIDSLSNHGSAQPIELSMTAVSVL
jgi:hypothetical protein